VTRSLRIAGWLAGAAVVAACSDTPKAPPTASALSSPTGTTAASVASVAPLVVDSLAARKRLALDWIELGKRHVLAERSPSARLPLLVALAIDACSIDPSAGTELLALIAQEAGHGPASNGMLMDAALACGDFARARSALQVAARDSDGRAEWKTAVAALNGDVARARAESKRIIAYDTAAGAPVEDPVALVDATRHVARLGGLAVLQLVEDLDDGEQWSALVLLVEALAKLGRDADFGTAREALGKAARRWKHPLLPIMADVHVASALVLLRRTEEARALLADLEARVARIEDGACGVLSEWPVALDGSYAGGLARACVEASRAKKPCNSCQLDAKAVVLVDRQAALELVALGKGAIQTDPERTRARAGDLELALSKVDAPTGGLEGEAAWAVWHWKDLEIPPAIVARVHELLETKR